MSISKWQISNEISGVIIGVWEAETADEAFAKMDQEMGVSVDFDGEDGSEGVVAVKLD